MPPAAKQGDKVMGQDTHIIMVPSPGGPVPTPTPMPFAGTITGGCSPNVLIQNMPAAVVGSTANNEPAARAGDTVNTCSDPAPAPNGKIVAVSTVMIGG